MTHAFGEAVSLNFALGAAGGTLRGLDPAAPPLLRVHLSPVWSIDLDALLRVRLHPDTQVEQQYLDDRVPAQPMPPR